MELSVVLSDAQVEAIAVRAAELVLERLPASSSVSPWMTPAEAAEWLRSTPAGVHDLLRRGLLDRHHRGSKVLLERRQVEALVVAERVAHVLPMAARSRAGSGVAR